MKQYENFYKEGFEYFQFNSLHLNNVLKNIVLGNLKPGFSLQQKYSSTLDLRPNVLDYDSVFLEVLKQNNIKSFIRSRTLKDLSLYHVQVRVAQSTTSYMDWHRDTYFDNSKKIGMAPPGCKIIYYPSFDDEFTNRLLIVPTSHRLMIDNRHEDLKLVERLPKKSISTSNEHAVLFDTSLLHAVVPDRPNETSIRLIYSFIAKEQMESSDELHQKTCKTYEDLV